MRNVLVRNLTKKKPHDRINVINQLFSGQCPVIRFKCSKSDKLLSEPVELLQDRHFLDVVSTSIDADISTPDTGPRLEPEPDENRTVRKLS